MTQEPVSRFSCCCLNLNLPERKPDTPGDVFPAAPPTEGNSCVEQVDLRQPVVWVEEKKGKLG